MRHSLPGAMGKSGSALAQLQIQCGFLLNPRPNILARSFHRNFEDATIRHRAQLARIAFGRLKRWLTGRRGLQQKQRLQLFTTCVYPVLTYGIFSIGITTVGLQHIQQLLYSQLRQILCNHAYITGHSHTYALSVNRVALPTEWLWRSAETLQRSVERRTLRAGPHDIVHQVD